MGNLILYICRSDIIQHRNGDKESDHNRRRDTTGGTGECIEGEECTAMAISKLDLNLIHLWGVRVCMIRNWMSCEAVDGS